MAEQQPAQRPPNVPEKFWDAASGQVRVDAVLNSYTELEKKLGQGTPPAQPAPAPAPPPIRLSEAADEYLKSGTLSSTTVERLQTQGITEAEIETYVRGSSVAEARFAEDMFKAVGGESTYRDLQNWAATSGQVTADELAMLDQALDNRNGPAAKLLLEGLRMRYNRANPVRMGEGSSGAPSNTSNGFASQRELVDAMKDPRYKKDEAYRNQVHARAERSSFDMSDSMRKSNFRVS